MSAKGALGWLILAVALAVPALMFWNWWKMLNARGPEIRRKAPPGEVFGGGKVSVANQLPNPVAAGGPAPVVAAQGSQTAPVAAPAAVPGTAPAGGRQGGQFPLPGNGPVPPQAAPAAGGMVPPKQEVEYSPKTARDPTISPGDLRRLAQMKAETERKRGGASRPGRVKRQEPPIETRISLMGIVAAGGTATAIVNGEIVREGDVVRIKDRRLVRVRRITANSVVFSFKGKNFSKSVNK